MASINYKLKITHSKFVNVNNLYYEKQKMKTYLLVFVNDIEK